MITTDAQNVYQATFIEYVIGGLQEALERVRTAEPLPDEHDRQLAWHILSYAFHFDETWPFTRELLLALAPKMEQAGFREDWLAYLQAGHRQAQAQQDQLTAAECELQIGILYRLQSKFDLAHQQLTTSVADFAALHALHDQARALNELAWLEHLQHRYTEANQHVEKALTLVNVEDSERAMCYRVLGMIAIDQEQWQEAEMFHRQALQFFEQQKDQRKIAWSMQNIAYSLRGQGKFEDAITYYWRAIALLDRKADVHSWAMVQMNLGIAYFRYGEATLAKKYHEEAHLVFQKLSDQLNLARNYTNIGLVSLALHDYKRAEMSFRTSAALFNDLGDKNWSLNAIDGLAMTYLAAKQYDLAAELLENALATLTEITNTPNYVYLSRSFNEHLQEARRGQGLDVTFP